MYPLAKSFARPVAEALGLHTRVSGGPLVWAITQSLGAELLVNADLSDGLTGYSTQATGDGTFTPVAPDGSAGSGGVRIQATSGISSIRQATSVGLQVCQVRGTVSAFTSGALRVGRRNLQQVNMNSIGTCLVLTHGAINEFEAYCPAAADLVVDAFEARLLNSNALITVPSADMRLDVRYTLPVSPLVGSQIWLVPRISDFANGNYWLALLEYAGSWWNITLYSVAGHSRTSRISATNIGATNGLRVNMNAGSISLYTTADGGATWTQRGTTISNTTYQTATGANAMHTSDFTAPVTMAYAAAN